MDQEISDDLAPDDVEEGFDPVEARVHAHIATARAEIVALRADLESAARADGAGMLEMRETIVAFHRRQSELERSLETIATALVRTTAALNRLSDDVRQLVPPPPPPPPPPPAPDVAVEPPDAEAEEPDPEDNAAD